jgi:hypothetical protein
MDVDPGVFVGGGVEDGPDVFVGVAGIVEVKVGEGPTEVDVPVVVGGTVVSVLVAGAQSDKIRQSTKETGNIHRVNLIDNIIRTFQCFEIEFLPGLMYFKPQRLFQAMKSCPDQIYRTAFHPLGYFQIKDLRLPLENCND